MKQKSAFHFSRIDYWLIGAHKLNDLVMNDDNLATFKTDHSSIILELEVNEESCKGPGFLEIKYFPLN